MKKFFYSVMLVFIFCLFAAAQEPASTPAPETKTERPISAGIVVDNSGSFRMVLEYVIKTAQAVSKVVEPDDEGFLVRFIGKDRIEVLQDFTNNKNSLASSADDMYVEGGLTAISEALAFSAKYLTGKGKNERKLLILISDGDNKSDKKVHAEVVRSLKDSNVSVFIICITAGLDGNLRESQKFMEKLAAETNGALVMVDRKMTPEDAADALIKAIRAK